VEDPSGGCTVDGIDTLCSDYATLANLGALRYEWDQVGPNGILRKNSHPIEPYGLGLFGVWLPDDARGNDKTLDFYLVNIYYLQNTYDPRVDFRDYALQLSNNGQPDDCLKLALLAYKAGQVFPGNAISGLLEGLTERSGLTGESDPNFRVGVLRRDTHFGNSFGAGGFIPMFQDNPPGNQVRHFVGWFAAGAFLGTSCSTQSALPGRRHINHERSRCRIRNASYKHGLSFQ
jgi:hypothetical protein